MRALRRLIDGTGPFSGLAAGAFAVGALMLLGILLTPNGWQWWLDAHQVHGQEVSGVVNYSFEGQRWEIDDPHTATRTGPRIVYVIAADPAGGSLSIVPTVILDWTLICGPVLIGSGLLALGFVRRSQRRRRPRLAGSSTGDTYGHGLPSDVVRSIIEGRQEGRAPRRPRRPFAP